MSSVGSLLLSGPLSVLTHLEWEKVPEGHLALLSVDTISLECLLQSRTWLQIMTSACVAKAAPGSCSTQVPTSCG